MRASSARAAAEARPPFTLNLSVKGGLAGMSRTEIKNLVKAAYMEIVTKGNSVRRVNASQARRGL